MECSRLLPRVKILLSRSFHHYSHSIPSYSVVNAANIRYWQPTSGSAEIGDVLWSKPNQRHAVNPSGFCRFTCRRFSSARGTYAEKKKNYYSILHISPKATSAQIKTAFYRLSLIHHPDKNKGSLDAQNKFAEIAEAYDILGNTDSRKEYDRQLNLLVTSGTGTISTHSKVREFRDRGLDHSFDTWTQHHYSSARLRTKKAFHTKKEFKERQSKLRNDVFERRTISFMLSLILIGTIGGSVYFKGLT